MKFKIFFLSSLVLIHFSAFSKDIAVVTLAIGESYQKTVSVGIENKRQYCSRYNYDFICGEESLDSARRPVWSKLLAILKAMENPSYQWIFWADADSLFMNFEIPLEHLIDENYNLIISKDMYDINAGHFFIRNCEESRRFLLDAYAHTEYDNHPFAEQKALTLEMNKRKQDYPCKILPQKSMNSYAKEVIGFLPSGVLKTVLYEEGDFIIHFAGAHEPNKLRNLLSKYSQKAIIGNCFVVEGERHELD